ncbi:hypothetical protein HHI36_013150 [Cryptolaemus montrouzieri]|uniref:Uncharacterized protein n=1 Tax=Cryptolaemus montrouzieri TaxID=559131 RepID=A0ABD2NGK0_9CUCU
MALILNRSRGTVEGTESKLLLEQVKSKLIGEARDVLINSRCSRWGEIKDVLTNTFGDPRSGEILLHDLTTCYQRHNESYEQNHENIKQKLQVLLEHISIREAYQDIKISKENNYTNLALYAYKSGLLEPYCSHLLNIHFDTLESALMECRKFNNERAHISFMNFLRGQSESTNVKREVIPKPQQLHFRPTPPWRMNN